MLLQSILLVRLSSIVWGSAMHCQVDLCVRGVCNNTRMTMVWRQQRDLYSGRSMLIFAFHMAPVGVRERNVDWCHHLLRSAIQSYMSTSVMWLMLKQLWHLYFGKEMLKAA